MDKIVVPVKLFHFEHDTASGEGYFRCFVCEAKIEDNSPLEDFAENVFTHLSNCEPVKQLGNVLAGTFRQNGVSKDARLYIRERVLKTLEPA